MASNTKALHQFESLSADVSEQQTSAETRAEKVSLHTESLDPFDPANQRISPNYAETVGVKQVLSTVPVRKPNSQDFFRVRGEQEYQLDTMVLQLKEDRDTYFVTPELQDALIDELVPVRLYLTMNRQGVLALWPARLPGDDGKTNDWWESALEASGMAMQSWIRMSADMSLGAYRIFQAKGELSPPVWPEGEFRDFLRIAFGKNMIDSLDHPIVQRLNGLS